MNTEHHSPSNLFAPVGPYSHVSKAGSFVQISGADGINPAAGKMAGGGSYGQARQILLNFQAMPDSIGLRLDCMLHIHVFLKNADGFAEMNRAYGELFPCRRPARTAVCVADSPKSGAPMTMNATAAEPAK